MAADDKTEIIRAPDPVAVGTQLSGTYELDKRIASGGMGEVYRGHNIQTGDPVAIKIVLPEFARDQTILSLFKKEASILNHLFHEAIVRYHVFSIDKDINRPYLAMEFVDGVSLADMMERGPMDPENARRLLVRLASGLAVAHEAGVIHRDLSPDNIVLPGGKVERAKIIDFGIARSASVGGETLLGGSFAGKYNFVSPEQLGMAGGEVTERSDIYSLGLVLAAVLRGKTINMTGSQVDVIEKRRVVPDLTGIDPRIRPVLEAMLQPDPRNRPTSMMEIVEGLRDVEPARARSVWDDAPAATLPPQAPAPPVADASKAGAPLIEDGWPPETSRTPAPWRTSDTTAPPVASIVGRPGDAATFGTPPPTLDAARPRKSGGLGLALVVVVGLAGVGGGGAYFGGYLDGLLPPRTTKTQPEPAAEQPTPPKPAEPAPSPTEPAQPEQPKPEQPPTEQPAAEQPKPEQPATPQQPATEQPKPEQPAAEQPKPVPTEPAQPPATEPTDPAQPVPDQPAAEQPTPPKPAPEQPPPATELPATQPPADAQPPVTQPEQPLQPAEEAVTPPATEPAEDPRLAWLKSYPGGDCFFASALNETDGKLHIEGFGSTVTPFESMLEAFKSAFPSDPEPDIGVRLIAPKQCPATAFMADLRDTAVAAPKLDLAKDVLFRGDPMAGGVALAPDRTTYLLLVDHDGIAHNLEGILKRSGDRAAFSVQLGLGAGEGIGKSPLPQMLVAFSSSSPVAAMQITKPVAAGELFLAIESELRDRGINAAAAARYFRIRG